MTLSRLAIVTGLLGWVRAATVAQTASDSPSFEVASVKPAAPNAHLRSMRGGPGSTDPGQITYTDVTPELLIVRAFRARPNEIIGPDWIKEIGFDIAAKIPPGTAEAQFQAMLRKLLEERFGMSFHREVKQFPVYLLTAAKVLPRLQPAQGDGYSGCRIVPKSASEKDAISETRVECRKVTMAALADRMPLFAKVNRRFVDESHIEGAYDFDFTWIPAQSGPSSLFDAMERHLGIKVVEQKAPIEMVVIDRINKVPVEN